MVKKTPLAIALIGIGCVSFFVFFVGYEKDQKMSEDPSVAQEVKTEDALIYWTNRSGKIRRIHSGSLDIDNLVTDVCAPIGIALDISGGQMYWTSGCKIQRANLDGSDVEDIIIDLKSPRGIALDVPNGKMYWAALDAGKIQRANLDGSDVEDIITGLLGPNGIALDSGRNKIYWADEFSGKIQCANLDGSNFKTLFVRYGKLGTALSIPLDILNLKIYYANSPIGIALDISGGKIYWTIPHKYKVQRANLDGSNVEDVVTDSILTIGVALSTAPQ